MSRIKETYPYFLGILAIGIIIGIVFTTGLNLENKGYAEKPSEGKIYSESTMQNPGLNAANFNPNTMFTEIVKDVKPAIVSISTTKNVKVPADPFHRFFREFGIPDERGGGRQQEFQQQGLGSGVIINKDGYILTNHHVIEDTDELMVVLTDGREFEAEIVGSDATTEIGLIKIDADDLPDAQLGNSDNVEIGEWVIAIGNPLGLSSTVTAGIVSALSRDINIIRGRNNPYGIENFIQTDAAINPGNSGGALVNMNGEVIGINTAIATETGRYMGYGFAVPINIAKNVVDDLMEYGEIRRGYLGVYIEPMNPVKAKGVGMDKPRGVLVTSVLAGEAADDAGIKQGDVILEVAGMPVNKTNELQARVASFDPGEKISLKIWRDGRELTIDATLEALDMGDISATTPEKKEEKKIQTVGLQVRDMNKSELNRLDLDYGILVQGVNRYSPAQKAGISVREVIYEIDGKEVESVSFFESYLEDQSSGDVVKLKLRSRDQNQQNFDRLVFMEIP